MPQGTTWTEVITAAVDLLQQHGLMPLVVASAVVALFGALLVALRRGVR